MSTFIDFKVSCYLMFICDDIRTINVISNDAYGFIPNSIQVITPNEQMFCIFNILPVQILHRPSEYFIFWSRLSVLSWPWNNFQLKSLHFLGMNLLLKFCVNHMSQLILLSCSLCSQYDLEAITGFLFTTNTLYISFSDRSLNAFRPTPGTSNNVSSKFSGVVFSFFFVMSYSSKNWVMQL